MADVDPDFDLYKLVTSAELSRMPNAKALIMQMIQDHVELGVDEALKRQKYLRARINMRDYAELVYEITPSRHHQAIIDFAEDETIERGLIIAPPGVAKSTWISGVKVSSHFSRYPDESILLVSNTLEQATKWTSSVRDIVDQSPEYKAIYPEILKDEDKGWTRQELFLANRQDRANVSPNLVGYGVGGPILGRRANLIVVDDPTSQAESRSPQQMQAQKEWFKATLMSRLIPHEQGGRILVVMTRWSEDDLAAMLMNEMDFQVLHMPALGDDERGAFCDYILPPVYDEEGEPDTEAYLVALQAEKEKHEAQGFECEITQSISIQRHCVRKYLAYEGENRRSIWPTRFSVKEYERIRRDFGSSQFRLIYQGDTSGASGDIIKREWFRYWGENVTATYEGDDHPFKELPEDCVWFQFTDIATGTTDKHDYFVIVTIAVDTKGRIFIVDVVRTRVEASDQPKLIQSHYEKHSKTQLILIESVAYQLSLFQRLSRELFLPVRKYKPVKDKVARARSCSAIYEQGRIYHKQDAKWLDTFEYELTTFPKGKHDDQMDALSGGLEELSHMFVRKPRVLQVNFG